MRKALKFLHTLGAIGFTGAIAALIVLHGLLPEPSSLERFATLRLAQGAVAKWLLLPSIGLVLASGVLSMAWTAGFHSAGWAWVKLAFGVVVFEGTLAYVQAPVERAGRNAEAVLAGELESTGLGATLGAEWGSFWVILAVAVLNVVLGVWRPRFSGARGRDQG